MTTARTRRLWRPMTAATAAVTVGFALAGLPGATAVPSGSAQVRDQTMYTISVRAVNGNVSGLAQRLIARGFDLFEARQGAVLSVLGTTATVARLSRVSGAAVVGKTPAAPTGAIAPAPQSQDSILPSRLDGKKYPTFYGGYRTTVAYDQFESDLQTRYPDLVKKIQYGKTSTGQHPLNVVCVTLGAKQGCKLTPDVDKPRLLLETQIHARELATSEMSWRLLSELVDGYGTDAEITALLQGSEVWVIPQVNPDGIAITEKGIEKDGLGSTSRAWQRKNDNEDQTPPGGCPPPWAGSQPGVDLNRNWAVEWGGASTSKDPCSEVFLGKAKMSETETKAMAKLTTSLFKDQRGSKPTDPAPLNTTGEMLTFHTNAGVNIIPWAYDSGVQTPNDEGIRGLAFRQSYFTGLRTGQAGQVLYDVGGGTDDWVYSKLGVMASTWELQDQAGCSGFFPAYTCMDGFAKVYVPALVYTAGAARAPYKLSLGPTITDLSAKASGGSVVVTATADDDAYGASGFGRPTAQKVTAARIYVGKAPWDGGTPKAMKIKGSGTSVEASASVKPGSKKVLAYVQGQDADGNWGATLAIWIPKA